MLMYKLAGDCMEGGIWQPNCDSIISLLIKCFWKPQLNHFTTNMDLKHQTLKEKCESPMKKMCFNKLCIFSNMFQNFVLWRGAVEASHEGLRGSHSNQSENISITTDIWRSMQRVRAQQVEEQLGRLISRLMLALD